MVYAFSSSLVWFGYQIIKYSNMVLNQSSIEWMMIPETTRQNIIGLFSKPIRKILTGFLETTQLQECM